MVIGSFVAFSICVRFIALKRLTYSIRQLSGSERLYLWMTSLELCVGVYQIRCPSDPGGEVPGVRFVDSTRAPSKLLCNHVDGDSTLAVLLSAP